MIQKKSHRDTVACQKWLWRGGLFLGAQFVVAEHDSKHVQCEIEHEGECGGGECGEEPLECRGMCRNEGAQHEGKEGEYQQGQEDVYELVAEGRFGVLGRLHGFEVCVFAAFVDSKGYL